MEKKYTVFIVEDNDVYRSLLTQIFYNETAQSDTSYDVYGFSSGEECMEKIYLNPDVIIMDYYLNGNEYVENMDGFTLVQKVKEYSPKSKIIVLSCQKNPNIIKRLLKENISAYINKGDNINQHKIIETVKNSLSAKKRGQWAW